MIIDLHCHSHFSDGLLSPNELLQEALAAGVELLALTDHDTIDGAKELQQLSASEPIKVLTGIEFSAQWKRQDLHILGYDIDLENQALQALIQQQRTARIVRAKRIAEQLEKLGFKDVYKQTCDLAGHEDLARPHFAQFLVNEGVVADKQAAFKQLLKRGRPAFVMTEWLSITEIIEGINAAGGQAVLAHPLKYKLTATKLKALIEAFIEAGGVGLEVVSGLMQSQSVHQLAILAERYHLLASSGSDYHGDLGSKVKLGRQMALPMHCKPFWEQWTT